MSPSIRHFTGHDVEMVIAMLLRRDEYNGAAHGHRAQVEVAA